MGMEKYLNHLPTCNKRKDLENCTCGLSDFLQDYKKAIADLNHHIINSSLNISGISDLNFSGTLENKNIQENISLIIREVKKFTKIFSS